MIARVMLVTISTAIPGAATSIGATAPIEFVFRVPPGGDPFAREIQGEVELPSGDRLLLPAFFAGDDHYAVRTHRGAIGTYRLHAVSETSAGATPAFAWQPVTPGTVENRQLARPFVRRDARDPRRFAFTTGEPYVPLGTNLAWGERGRLDFYERIFPQFAREGLNWTRVWMCHWGGFNPDWLPPDLGPSPRPGVLDARVAANWDTLLELAETHGIHLQLVLQHHGQFSTVVNPNWHDNPWSAAHPGGFLRTPTEFFTSPEARRLTKQRYRYIVARWGWSPAVLAWELFNEVHWVDAIRLEKNTAAVAAWHDEMADHLRALDVHRHLVTTSTDDLRSPIYARMDFFQPHLYAVNMLAATRVFEAAAPPLDRPMFYGEFGDNHQRITPAQIDSGIALVPPLWSGLMGDGTQPAQLWYGARLIDNGRLGELGAVARFLAATRLFERPELVSFSPALDSDARMSLVIEPGQHWQRRPGPDFAVALDGREPPGLADVPEFFVSTAGSAREQYPDRATFRFAPPRTTRVTVRFADGGAGGAHARVLLDGISAGEHHWPALRAGMPRPAGKRPAELSFTVPAGAHAFELVNESGPDWFQLDAIDLGLDRPVLAAVGQRADDFITLWIWHRRDVFALEPGAGAIGTIVLDDVPTGAWQVTWWDTLAGIPHETTTLMHDGGPLPLVTPTIVRHAAVVLHRRGNVLR